jgi:hypothetical protein
MENSLKTKSFKRGLAEWLRLVHIYLSMFGLPIVFFFAITGFTLNHSEWFGWAEPRVRTVEGAIAAEYFDPLDKLLIVEQIRNDFQVRGAMTSFEVEEETIWIEFKHPGGYANVEIDRARQHAAATIESSGPIAIINDLHMGRDSGPGWSWVIDVSAILMALSSVTGFVMLLMMPKRRISGLIVAAVGVVTVLIVYWVCVP